MKHRANITPPSPWVVHFSAHIPKGGAILDIACGAGRHSRFFLEHGHAVTAIDRSLENVKDLQNSAELICEDLETDAPWPLKDRQFDAVVVTNYLHRPLYEALIQSVAPGGVLIYETFAQGNEAYGKPSRPAFLLQKGELLARVKGRLKVIAYAHGEIITPHRAIKQSICAIKP